MWGCGLRASEVLSLQLGDVLFQEFALRIHGKGQKQRVMPMAQSVAALLHHDLSTERPKRATPATFDELFQTLIRQLETLRRDPATRLRPQN